MGRRITNEIEIERDTEKNICREKTKEGGK